MKKKNWHWKQKVTEVLKIEFEWKVQGFKIMKFSFWKVRGRFKDKISDIKRLKFTDNFSKKIHK